MRALLGRGRPRSRRPAPFAGLLLLLLLAGLTAFPSASALSDPEGDGATAEWNQWGGNSARTFAAGVEPVRTAPRVRWSVEVPGEVVAGPVCWGGIAVVCCRDRGEAFLRAYALEDGRPLGSHYLGKSGGAAGLAAWQGMYLVASGGTLRGIRHQGSTFTRTWSYEEDVSWIEPAVSRGVVYFVRAGRIASLDAVTGRSVGLTSVLCDSPPVVVEGVHAPWIAGVYANTSERYEGRLAFLNLVGGEKAAFGATILAPFARSAYSPGLRLLRIPAGDRGPGGWFVISSEPFRGRSQGFPSASSPDGSRDLSGGLCTISQNPTARGGCVTGFAENGDLVSILATGQSGVVVSADRLPRGARPGPAARAGAVTTFGNWAVDLDTARVLWCLPDLELRGAAIPVADRTLLASAKGGKLLCLSDAGGGSESPTAAAADPRAKGGPEPPSPAASRPPSEKDALLLVDGREVEGRVELLPEGRARVAPAAGGAAVEAPLAEVLLAQADGKVLHRGRESDAVARWRAWLRPSTVRTLEEIYESLSKENLLRACSDVLREAREWGLSEERAGEMSRATAGRQENKFAGVRQPAVQPALDAKRAVARDRHLQAAEWCRVRGFPVSAACLIGDADRIAPGSDIVEARARALLPAGFPWAASEKPGRRWIAWAREMAAADAEFVAPGDEVRNRESRGFWRDAEDVVVLRTPNVIFRSRCLDPQVVGRCLRNSEWTVRALTELLGPDTILPIAGDGDRMDVRLHPRREDYLRDGTPDSGYPMPWSAGCYSPLEGVSRFFVPEAGAGDPLGRGLFSVLAHELTHHFVERRWRGAGVRNRVPIDVRGYWCVEGIARFVEDQVMEMDRRGMRFDDRTVPSLDTVVQATAQGVLFRPAALLDATKREFHMLPTKDNLRVSLRNSLQTRLLSPLSLFYEQSGTMVYYMVNHRGRDGRLNFLAYLSTYYAGADPGPGWKALGFTSAEDCDAGFKEFVQGLK